MGLCIGSCDLVLRAAEYKENLVTSPPESACVRAGIGHLTGLLF